MTAPGTLKLANNDTVSIQATSRVKKSCSVESSLVVDIKRKKAMTLYACCSCEYRSCVAGCIKTRTVWYMEQSHDRLRAVSSFGYISVQPTKTDKHNRKDDGHKTSVSD